MRTGFKHRILAFKAGKPMSIPDGQIASIAKANHAIITTRNISDFIQCDIELINPFD